MHTKMLRYERVIQDLNQKRIAKQPMELCQALEDTVKGDTVSDGFRTPVGVWLTIRNTQPSLSPTTSSLILFKSPPCAMPPTDSSLSRCRRGSMPRRIWEIKEGTRQRCSGRD